MAEHAERPPDALEDRPQVLDLPLWVVRRRVPTPAPAPPRYQPQLEAFGKCRRHRPPDPPIDRRAVHHHERLPRADPLDDDRRPIGRGDRGERRFHVRCIHTGAMLTRGGGAMPVIRRETIDNKPDWLKASAFGMFRVPKGGEVEDRK